MFASAFGTATTFGSWGFFILKHALDFIYEPSHWVHCRSVAQLNDEWGHRDGQPILITSDIPDTNLARLLTTSGAPCFAFVDEAEDAIAIASQVKDIPVEQAAREFTHSFSSFREVFLPDATHVFHNQNYYARPVVDILSNILDALSAPTSEEIILNILQRAHPDIKIDLNLTLGDSMFLYSGKSFPPGHAINLLSPRNQELVRATAEGYQPILEMREMTSVHWPRELFFANNPENSAVHEILMIGSARHLVWGPYCCLPAGHWLATAQIEVSENFSGNQIEADITVERGTITLAKGRANVPTVGVFNLFMEFTTGENLSPIEIRIFMLKGAIEGRLRFSWVKIERL